MTDEDLKENCAWCKQVLQDYTSHPFELYVDHDHPDMVALIGSWNSIEEHFQELHKSEDFMEIMHQFGGVIIVKSSFHVNISRKEFEKVTEGKDVLVMNRMWIPDKRYAEFSKKYDEVYLPQAGEAGAQNVISGWRITDGGWTEMDAIDYFAENPEEHSVAQPGSEDVEALQDMNELVSLLGFDSIKEADEFTKKSRTAVEKSYVQMAARLYTRRWVKMDLPPPPGSDEEEDSD